MTNNQMMLFLDIRRGTRTQEAIGTHEGDLKFLIKKGLIVKDSHEELYITQKGDTLFQLWEEATKSL